MPLVVEYCPVCGLPPEYCEFGPTPEACAAQCARFAATTAEGGPAPPAVDGAAPGEVAAASAPQAPRAGKVPKKPLPQEIVLTQVNRGKGKHVTTLYGLDTFGVKLKEAAKLLCKKCSTGCSVEDDEEKKQSYLMLQGDFVEFLANLVVSEYKVPAGSIYVVEKKKKAPWKTE